MNNDFSQILSTVLKDNELNQSEFARKIGAKPYNVCDWLRGKAKPGYDNLRAMAKAFNIPADYLLGLIDTY